MKLCPNCHREVLSDSKFCTYCGEDLDKPEIEQEELEIVQPEHEHQHPDQRERAAEVTESSESEEPLAEPKKLFALNKYIVGSLLAIIAVFSVLLAVITLKPTEKEIVLPQGLETDVAAETLGAPETIQMADENFQLYVNRTEQLSFYTYPEVADQSGLTWSSSTDAIQVNQSGYLYSSVPEAEGTVTISNADGTVKAESHVRVSTKDEAFYSTLDHINQTEEDGLEQLDYAKEAFRTGNQREEDYMLAVEDFTAINEQIEGYLLKQKQFVNVKTNNRVDVDVYSHRETGDIRKIVAIEYLEDDTLDITDYYFMDGQVRFIFNRNENYYRPVAAKQDFVGNRYYYYHDTMLLWRNIEKPYDHFTKTDYSFTKGKIDWKTYEYGDIDEDDVNQEKVDYVKPADDAAHTEEQQGLFVQHEQQMLDSAYNLYKQVTASPDMITLTGYVLYPNSGDPMAGATVKAFSEQYELLVGESKVNDEGMYSIKVPMHYGEYSLYVNEPNYVDTMIHGIDSNQNVSSMMQETVYMYERSDERYSIHVNLVDAISGMNFEPDDSTLVELFIRRGINNKYGEVSQRLTVDLYDSEPISLAPGNYTAEIRIPGYESNYFTISTLYQDMTVHSNIVPKIAEGEVKIVLTWSSDPEDLDSHLFSPNGDHISYYSREIRNGWLDVDEVSGYGPETVTLQGVGNATYKYYVADYTNLVNDNYDSYNMSNSFARVDVYMKNDTQSFIIPRNSSAVIWQVFNITNGRIVPVQRLYNNVEDKEWWSASKY